MLDSCKLAPAANAHGASDAALDGLRAALARLDPDAEPRNWFDDLVRRGHDDLPLPGSGATLQRWRALALVAQRDLSLVKLYEGHTDAIAILSELGASSVLRPGDTWATWAAESPSGRTVVEIGSGGRVQLHGVKHWCSGAAHVSHALLTAWRADGRGPLLVRVSMSQPTVAVTQGGWRAIGMAGCASLDVAFDGAEADLVGDEGQYLSRPGFWQGGAGIAACWYGGGRALGRALHDGVRKSSLHGAHAFKTAALGAIDIALSSTAALLREAAAWIDAHPRDDASAVALRVRLAAEATATRVLDEAGRALGASAFCRDGRFARMAADLPVFVSQSHGAQDLAALGERSLSNREHAWSL